MDADPGRGTPYHPHVNDRAMLANIASFELPAVCETLVDWLSRQSDDELERLSIARKNIDDREFYPRVVLGEYFQSQFRALLETGKHNGHDIDVRPQHRVTDIRLQPDDIALTAKLPNGELKYYAFGHVVMATGHNLPDDTEVKPGYFISPWPAARLKTIKAGPVGILGTSLSAIDALVSVATAHGTFLLDESGVLQFQIADRSEALHITMMSRKGLLPEADFYFDFPFAPLAFCNDVAISRLTQAGSSHLLDQVFALFRQELLAADPEYSAKIGLAALDVETFAEAYFAARAEADPFVWAASNLAEAEHDRAQQRTVAWRYAILRMHEVVGRAVRHLNDHDLARFLKSFKTVFVDDYATVPYQSIQRLLALRRADKVDVLALGDHYQIKTPDFAGGAVVRAPGIQRSFDAFIDATGQPSLSAGDLPFPGLVEHGVVGEALTTVRSSLVDAEEPPALTATGGLDVDQAFRPKRTEGMSNQLYCVAISFLLHKLPFVQGIPSASEMGQTVSSTIIASLRGDTATAPQEAAITMLIMP
ncbi:putative NAD(P)/FAD-binding protein YdhS [Variibacter gotjawalensis]|nr:putative NAD(P)/FAD-binding protein YdhS [Variibacter gotjawalensis]